MKTVFINGSPKKHFSASNYFLKLQSAFVRGQAVFLKLRNKGDHKNILEQIIDADAVVFSMPLYVDGPPSHILAFLQDMEIFCKAHHLCLKIYAISNNGFIEGKQNAPLFYVLKNFCVRSDIQWCGGIGIGGGVMFNALRIVFFIEMGIFLLSVFISGVFYGNWVPPGTIYRFTTTLLIIALFHLGVFFYMLKMGRQINRRGFFAEKYTRILLPSFLFILITDVYFVIVSLFRGGIFRGWLKKK